MAIEGRFRLTLSERRTARSGAPACAAPTERVLEHARKGVKRNRFDGTTRPAAKVNAWWAPWACMVAVAGLGAMRACLSRLSGAWFLNRMKGLSEKIIGRSGARRDASWRLTSLLQAHGDRAAPHRCRTFFRGCLGRTGLLGVGRGVEGRKAVPLGTGVRSCHCLRRDRVLAVRLFPDAHEGRPFENMAMGNCNSNARNREMSSPQKLLTRRDTA